MVKKKKWFFLVSLDHLKDMPMLSSPKHPHGAPWAAQPKDGVTAGHHKKDPKLSSTTGVKKQTKQKEKKKKSSYKLACNICEPQLGFPYLPGSRPCRCAAQHAGGPWCKSMWKYLCHQKVPLHVPMDPEHWAALSLQQTPLVPTKRLKTGTEHYE